VKDHTQKPAFVLTFDADGKGKGSGRAPQGVDLSALIHGALAEELIQQGGGHQAAGGISLSKEQLPAFHAFCQTFLRNHPPQPLPPHIISKTLTFQALTVSLWENLKRLEPFGAGNKAPLFAFENVHLLKKRTFAGNHFELELAQEVGRPVKALLFGGVGSIFETFLKDPYLTTFHLIASVTFDDYTQRLTLIVEDIVPALPPATQRVS
jgi:single-stranded-DNA-specific exonuclease